MNIKNIVRICMILLGVIMLSGSIATFEPLSTALFFGSILFALLAQLIPIEIPEPAKAMLQNNDRMLAQPRQYKEPILQKKSLAQKEMEKMMRQKKVEARMKELEAQQQEYEDMVEGTQTQKPVLQPKPASKMPQSKIPMMQNPQIDQNIIDEPTSEPDYKYQDNIEEQQMQDERQQEDPYQCPYCNYVGKTEHYLNMHIISKHKDEFNKSIGR